MVVETASDVMPTATQWSDEYDTVSADDGITVTVQDGAAAVRVEWRTKEAEPEAEAQAEAGADGEWVLFERYSIG